MRAFGTNEYGNKDGFKVICCRCGKEAQLVPTHHYRDGEYKTPEKVTLELRCTCGNRYGATIHSDR
jgi:hypothetical protein